MPSAEGTTRSMLSGATDSGTREAAPRCFQKPLERVELENAQARWPGSEAQSTGHHTEALPPAVSAKGRRPRRIRYREEADCIIFIAWSVNTSQATCLRYHGAGVLGMEASSSDGRPPRRPPRGAGCPRPQADELHVQGACEAGAGTEERSTVYCASSWMRTRTGNLSSRTTRSSTHGQQPLGLVPQALGWEGKQLGHTSQVQAMHKVLSEGRPGEGQVLRQWGASD